MKLMAGSIEIVNDVIKETEMHVKVRPRCCPENSSRAVLLAEPGQDQCIRCACRNIL